MLVAGVWRGSGARINQICMFVDEKGQCSDVGVLAVTSADRIIAGWTAAQRERARGNTAAVSHVERLLGGLPRHCSIVTVIDGHPATLGWLGSVAGHRTISHGVEHFGQTGTIGDLYRHFRIDRDALVASVHGLTSGARR